MNKFFSHVFALLMVMCMAFGAANVSFADEAADEAVQAVIAQLEAIDTLQQMQDARSQYTAKYHYDINTTDE